MASFLDQARLANDPGWYDRLRVALVSAAVDIQAEDPATPNHTNRVSLAHQILSGPVDRQRDSFAWAIACGPFSLADSYVTAARDATALLDNDIEFSVNSVWDAISAPAA